MYSFANNHSNRGKGFREASAIGDDDNDLGVPLLLLSGTRSTDTAAAAGEESSRMSRVSRVTPTPTASVSAAP